MNRFAFSHVAFATALASLAACNEPSPQADALPEGASLAKLSADMQLSDKVKQALQETSRRHVEVAAKDGVVTLYGLVEQYAEKDRIALAVLEVEGVRSVVNNLVVLRAS